MSCRFGRAVVGWGAGELHFAMERQGYFGGGNGGVITVLSFIHSFTATMHLDINNRHFRDLVGATSSRRDEIRSVFGRQP